MIKIRCIYIILFFICSCKCSTTDSLCNKLDPINKSVYQFYPFAEEHYFSYSSQTDLLIDVCPEIQPDTGYMKVNIIPTDSLDISDIMFIRLQVSRIKGAKSTKEQFVDSLGRKLVGVIKRGVLIDSLYTPNPPCQYIFVPNIMVFKGEFEILYGVYLKSDSISKRLKWHTRKCRFTLKQDLIPGNPYIES